MNKEKLFYDKNGDAYDVNGNYVSSDDENTKFPKYILHPRIALTVIALEEAGFDVWRSLPGGEHEWPTILFHGTDTGPMALGFAIGKDWPVRQLCKVWRYVPRHKLSESILRRIPDGLNHPHWELSFYEPPI